MIRWLVNMLAAPLVRLGERYIEAQADKDKLRAGAARAALASIFGLSILDRRLRR